MAEVTLEDVPRKVKELYEKGFAAFERGNLDYAIEMFNTALSLEPGLLKARKFKRAADLKKAKAAGGGFGKKLSGIKGMSTVLKVQASLKKNPIKAMELAEGLLTMDPSNRQFINAFSDAAIASGFPEAALQTLEIAKDANPEDTKLLETLGSLYLENDKPHEARATYETLVRLKPNDQQAIKKLKDATALDTMQTGGWEGAESYRDVMKDKKEAEILEQESKSVRAEKGLDALITETEEKIKREPENLNYKRALGDLYRKSNRFDEAIAIIKEALDFTGGGDPELDRLLSSTRIQKLEAEVKEYEELGDEAGATAKKEELQAFQLDDARDRVRRYPNDLQYKFDLGEFLFKANELNDAIQQFQAAQRHPQRRLRALYYLGMCFKAKNQNDIALEQLEKAASELNVMDATKKDIIYELGQIAEAMTDKDKALGYYKEIYAVDIGYRDVATKIEEGI